MTRQFVTLSRTNTSIAEQDVATWVAHSGSSESDEHLHNIRQYITA